MKVAVVQGGPSTEAEVSRASARSLAQALRTAGHDVSFAELGPGLGTELMAASPDVVFPVAHGAQGEDGCLQGMLEILRLPYVGCRVAASAICADKSKAKIFLSRAGVSVAPEVQLSGADLQRSADELLAELRCRLGPAFIVKPTAGGSTIGISRLLESAGPADLTRALQSASRLDDIVLVEKYIAGTEVTCSVLEEDGRPRALAVTSIQAQASDWYDFQSKYGPGGSRHICPAPLDDALTRRVLRAAENAHRAVGARDLSRTDFIIEAGEPIALEVNTLPGMTEVSLFPEAAAAVGLRFPELADRLVLQAFERRQRFLDDLAPVLPGT